MRIGEPRPGAAALVLASLLAGSMAYAADRVRVAVIHARDDEPSRRVRGEIGAAGLEPVDAPLGASDARTTVTVVRDTDAIAGVRVLSADEMEIAIIGAAPDQMLYGKVVRADESGRDSLALRAVEDLRARLVKLHLAPPPAEVGTAASPPAPAPPQQDQGARPARTIDGRNLWLTGAIGASTSAGGLGADVAAHLGARFDATPRIAGSLAVTLPLASQSVLAAGAHADVNVYAVDALLHYAFVDQDPWTADIGAGAGVVVAKMQGFAESPVYTGRAETLVAGAPVVDASVAVRAMSIVRLRAQALAGVAMPRLAVTFDHEDVAVWGRPFALALLGVEVALLPRSGAEGKP